MSNKNGLDIFDLKNYKIRSQYVDYLFNKKNLSIFFVVHLLEKINSTTNSPFLLLETSILYPLLS